MVYIKNITDLDGKLGEYEKSVRRISVLYKKAEKSCKDDGYFYALKVAAVAHGYILRAVSVMDKFYGYYDAAAKVQYTDGERFGEYLDLPCLRLPVFPIRCSERTGTCGGKCAITSGSRKRASSKNTMSNWVFITNGWIGRT